MSFRLVEFDGLTLPDNNAVDNFDAGVRAAQRPLPNGGVYDYYRDLRAPFEAATITRRTLIIAESESDWRTQVSAVRNKLGIKGLLWREWFGGSRQSINARLSEVLHSQSAIDYFATSMTLVFTATDPSWSGAGPTSLVQPSGPLLRTDIAEFGDAPITAINLGIIPDSNTDIQRITISNAYTNITFEGPIRPRVVLRIDSGMNVVTLNQQPAYDGIRRNDGHKVPSLLYLASDSLYFDYHAVYNNGGRFSTSVTYYQQWA